ncbi:MAG: hypothetical protein K6C95_07505 [Lachnospiraceae bacterium]|nr:hypothetical protein [Lachnospiraceae bacterium]
MGKDHISTRIATIIIILPVLVLCTAGIFLCGISSAPQRNWDTWGAHEKQYEALTESISTHHIALGERPAEFLSELDNPYDPVERSIAAAEHDSYALIDIAYYNDKYYVYFGLTPELLVFFPFKLITGRTLPTWIADIFMALLCVPAAFLFCRLLIRRFSDRGSSDILLVTAFGILLIGAIGLPYLAALCTTYSMPSVTGLFLILCGLSVFLAAESPDGKISRPHLIIGSVLLALTIGCRPTLCLAFLLLFGIFADAVKRGDFFRLRGNSMANTLCVLIPAALTSLPFLAYNLLRFGSPFDFGYHYLLTTRDLLHGTKSLGESIASAWLLLLSPVKFSAEFPFMQIFDYTGQYADTLYVEPLFGGLLPLHPFITAGLVLLPVACILSAKKGGQSAEQITMKASKAAAGLHPVLISVISLITGIVILFTDSVVAGVSQRYSSDFALFFFIPSMIGFYLTFAVIRSKRPRLAYLLAAAAVLFMIIEVFVSASSILCDGRYFAMKDWNTEVYERISGVFR